MPSTKKWVPWNEFPPLHPVKTRCKTCRGRGKVYVYSCGSNGYPGGMAWLQCGDCRGSGKRGVCYVPLVP